jgi:hypothetical protein
VGRRRRRCGPLFSHTAPETSPIIVSSYSVSPYYYVCPHTGKSNAQGEMQRQQLEAEVQWLTTELEEANYQGTEMQKLKAHVDDSCGVDVVRIPGVSSMSMLERDLKAADRLANVLLSSMSVLESDLKEANRLANDHMEQIKHLQSLQARQIIIPGPPDNANQSEPAECSVPPPLGESSSLHSQAQPESIPKTNAMNNKLDPVVEKLLDVCHSSMLLEGKTFEDLFSALDNEHLGELSMDDIEDIFKKAGAPLHGDTRRSVFDHLRSGRSGGVGLEHLRQTIGLHAQRRKLADLLSHADLPRLVARYVLPLPTDTIASLQKVDAPALSERISALEPEILAAILGLSTTVADEQQQTHMPAQGGGNNKFASLAEDDDGLIQARYGDTSLFTQMGLQGLIGRPDASADIQSTIKAEHAAAAKFRPGNYPGDRSPEEEWVCMYTYVYNIYTYIYMINMCIYICWCVLCVCVCVCVCVHAGVRLRA